MASDTDFVTVKIWRRSQRLLKLLAALEDQTAAEYLDDMLRGLAAKEMPKLQKMIGQAAKEADGPLEVGKKSS